jgi:nicotinamide mononucleotide (NMN) deamidase PncC
VHQSISIGFITYSNQAKIKILKVNKNIIKKYGAVSMNVVSYGSKFI